VAARLSLVDRADPVLSIVAQCRLLKVARSTLYYRPAEVSADDLAVMRRLDELYLAWPFYGSRRMVAVLRREGWEVNRKRVRRLVRVMGLEAIYQKPNTSAAHPQHKVYPYLLRRMVIDRPNQVWCADITYIPMAKGFVYLVVVMDWFSRRVLSWRLSIGLETGLFRGADRGDGAVWATGGVQHRPGSAVHVRGVRRRTGGAGGAGQHGRPGAISGQHLHRASVAEPEIRGGVHQGVWVGGGGAARDWRVAGIL
jgi:transposase InsO family protein